MELYKPPFFNKKDFLFHLNNAYIFCTTYENTIMIRDFSMIPENKKLSDFCEMSKFEQLILKPTCLSVHTTDLLVANHAQSFMR